jgi:serine/threonine-protein kinase RsbW
LNTLHVTAEERHLREAMVWLDAQCTANSIGNEDSLRLAIVLEELFLNVSTYNGLPPPEVDLSFAREPLALELVIEDDGVEFDPTAAESPNLSGDVNERIIGNLGIHMVMKLMDEVTYTRHGHHNRLVLRKFLSPA